MIYSSKFLFMLFFQNLYFSKFIFFFNFLNNKNFLENKFFNDIYQSKIVNIKFFYFTKYFYYFYFTKYFWKKYNYFFFLKSIFLKKKNNYLNYIFYKNWYYIKKKKRAFSTIFYKYLKNKNVGFFSKFFIKLFDFKKNVLKYNLENYKLINIFFFKKNAKKKRLVKFISSNKHKPNNQIFSALEFYLFNILLRSHFIFFLNDLMFFIQNGYVFVNGLIVTNPFFKLKINDRVQLIIFKNYFFFIKSKLNAFFKNLFKIKIKIWHINRNRLNYYKQSSKHIPEWVGNTLLYKNDIPKYLEVDYLILMTIIIFKPNNFYYFNYFFFKFLSNYMFKLYLWKNKS